MKTILLPLLATLAGPLRNRAVLHLEILALRQQLAMITHKDRKRLRFHPRERLFWVWLYRLWPPCLQTRVVFIASTDAPPEEQTRRPPFPPTDLLC